MMAEVTVFERSKLSWWDDSRHHYILSSTI